MELLGFLGEAFQKVPGLVLQGQLEQRRPDVPVGDVRPIMVAQALDEAPDLGILDLHYRQSIASGED